MDPKTTRKQGTAEKRLSVSYCLDTSGPLFLLSTLAFIHIFDRLLFRMYLQDQFKNIVVYHGCPQSLFYAASLMF